MNGYGVQYICASRRKLHYERHVWVPGNIPALKKTSRLWLLHNSRDGLPSFMQLAKVSAYYPLYFLHCSIFKTTLMRLLRLDSNDRLSLVELFGKNIPPYAILSHTWGADGEEVTFQDMMTGRGEDKPGYDKINFCKEKVIHDRLQYFWVDSCCIDKSSSAELSEAINSMFRWYQGAAKCYVYLSDVSTNGLGEHEMLSLPIGNSKWFTRSWTLQELIAPKVVEFFSREHVKLGTKQTRRNEIRDVTGIPTEALDGDCPLSSFSREDRMSWAAKREAKREEDTAYSLLGIFDANMPLIYGEGRKKAFIRLKREIEESSRDEWAALPSTLPTDKSEEQLDPASVRSYLRGPDNVDPLDISGPHERSTGQVAYAATCDASDTPPTRSTEGQPNRVASPSCRTHDESHQFNIFGGSQYNNIGSGNQFLATFNGPVRFR